MASYTKSGLMTKVLLESFYVKYPLVLTDEWHDLESRALPLEDELDHLRSDEDGYSRLPKGADLDRARAIRRELAVIGIRQHEILLEMNPTCKEYWNL